MVDMKTVAHQARQAGWAPVALHGVSPDGQYCHCPQGGNCPSKGKHPIEKGWEDQPFPSAADIEATWDRRKSANVGIRTGSISGNLIVLDIDAGGREALAPLVNANGGMPETLVVQTGSGGYHYYFIAPEGVEIRNSQGKVAPHVDIRGEDGQAVAPGSRTDKGAYSIAHSAPIAPMPQWLIDPAVGDRAEVEFIPAAVAKRPQTPEEASYEGNMLSKQLGDRLGVLQNKPWAPGDAWDQTCFEVACHLVELANSEWAAITPEEAYQRFMAAAPSDDQWDEREAKWRQAVSTCGNKAKEGPKGSGSIMDAAVVPDPHSAPQGAPTAARGSHLLTDSDATMVDEFAERHLTGRALYVKQSREWRVYEGGVWEESSVKVVREMFRQYVLAQLAEAASAGDAERVKLLTKYTAAGKIKSIAELSEGRMVVDAEAFDQRLDLMVVGNGVLDLRTGEIAPHDPFLLFTRRTSVDYTPGATHPDVTEMLKALPEDCLGWMQTRLGQAITGYPTWDDVMPILQGGGANGKSSIIVGLQKALGGYMAMVSERVLLASNSDHTTDLTDLRGTRLAVIEELPQDSPLNIKRLKDTLGTAKITARRMRENNATWLATHSLFLTTNYIPRVIETDHGTWRRLALVKFPWRYVAAGQPLVQPEDRRGDDRLRHRVEAGAEGQHEAILAWLVEGAKAWYSMNRARLASPPSVEENTSTWRTEADKIWGFLQERMEFDPASQVLSTDLFLEFSSYLASIGSPNWTDQTFAVRLREHHLAHENQISKVRTVRLEGLSRPGEVYQDFAPGQQATVWRGLKFAERAPKKGVANLADWR